MYKLSNHILPIICANTEHRVSVMGNYEGPAKRVEGVTAPGREMTADQEMVADPERKKRIE